MIEREYSGFYIDGEWRDSESADAIDVISPRSGERIGGEGEGGEGHGAPWRGGWVRALP